MIGNLETDGILTRNAIIFSMQPTKRSFHDGDDCNFATESKIRFGCLSANVPYAKHFQFYKLCLNECFSISSAAPVGGRKLWNVGRV